MPYDRARQNLDRHANRILAAFMAQARDPEMPMRARLLTAAIRTSMSLVCALPLLEKAPRGSPSDP